MQTMYKTFSGIDTYFVVSAKIFLCVNPFCIMRHFEKY